MKKPDRAKQPTPQELTDSCLTLLRDKFYKGDDRCFFKDRGLLLKWVVLWPASWLNEKGVTIHGDRYRQIFVDVFINAAAHVESKIKYRPAYLRQVIQSHFAMHGEKYYEEAKAIRNRMETVMLALGKPVPRQDDPVKDLAAARKILTSLKPGKRGVKRPLNSQPDLFS